VAVNNDIVGLLQYPTRAMGDAVVAYLATWEAAHAELLVQQARSIVDLDPPAEGLCVCQVDIRYRLHTDDQATFQYHMEELGNYVYTNPSLGGNGIVGTADCSSVYGAE